MKNKSSFIYGESPSDVPVYAVVSMCTGDGRKEAEVVTQNNGEFSERLGRDQPIFLIQPSS